MSWVMNLIKFFGEKSFLVNVFAFSVLRAIETASPVGMPYVWAKFMHRRVVMCVQENPF